MARSSQQAAPGAEAAPLPLAVASFSALTTAPDTRRLLAGLRSGLLSALALSPRLHVAADTFDPTSVRPESADDGQLTAFSGAIVRVAAARADERLHLLVSVEYEGRTLGVRALAFPWEELSATPTRLSLAVSALLFGETVTPTAPAPVLPQTAYEQYLLARYHAQRFTPEDSDAAIEHFRAVLTSAPTYAPALSGIAAATFQQLRYGALPASQRPTVRPWAEQAVSRDPENVEGHIVLALVAFYHDRDMRAASDAFRHALSLGHDRVTSLREVAWFYLALGYDALAVEAADRALEYDPLSVDLLCLRADIARYIGDAQGARASYARARALDVRYTRALEGLAMTASALGDREGAYAALDLYRRSEPNRYWRHRLAGEVATRFEDTALLRRSIQALHAYASAHPEADLSSDLASVYAATDPDAAMRHLADAVDHGVGIASVLRYPAFAPLRAREDYRALVAGFDTDVEPPPLAPRRTRVLRLHSEHADVLHLAEHAFLYAEAAGNYVSIHFAQGHEVQRRLLRARLADLHRQAEDQLGAGAVVRAHRAFLVRVSPDVTLHGTARTAHLRLERFGVEVPVSRRAYPAVRHALEGRR